ncbi:phosphatidylinositol N-acetylglucosaminyltransferase [Salix suchowensis]|nr:phosphatidylinositol N-acetylglucosaminyltransferase [Salix suchowensis]
MDNFEFAFESGFPHWFCKVPAAAAPPPKLAPKREMVFSSETAMFRGWLFILMGSVSFVGFLFATVISKLLPLSDNPIISAIQNDSYYCFLVPLTLPILVIAVYFHWLSMKMFKHA